MAPQERLKHSKAGLAQSPVGSLGPGAHKILFEPSEELCQVWGLVLNDFTPLTIFLGLLLCLWTWDIFFWWYPTFSGGWLFSSEF